MAPSHSLQSLRRTVDLTPSPVRAHFFCRGCLQRFGVHSAHGVVNALSVKESQWTKMLDFCPSHVSVLWYGRNVPNTMLCLMTISAVRVHGVSRLTHSTSFPDTCYPGIVIGQRLSWGVFVPFLLPSRCVPRTQLSEPWHLSLRASAYAQWSAVYNALSFGIAAMGSATIFFWLQVPNVTKTYRTALTITGIVTFIAAYHYFGVFNSWVEAALMVALGYRWRDSGQIARALVLVALGHDPVLLRRLPVDGRVERGHQQAGVQHGIRSLFLLLAT